MEKKLNKILYSALLGGALSLGAGCYFVPPKSTQHPFTGKGVTVTYNAKSYKINLHLNRSEYVDFEHQALGRDLKDETDYLTVRVFPRSESVTLKDEKCDGSVDAIIENGNTILKSKENEERFKDADRTLAHYIKKMKVVINTVDKQWEENYKGIN